MKPRQTPKDENIPERVIALEKEINDLRKLVVSGVKANATLDKIIKQLTTRVNSNESNIRLNSSKR